MTNQIHIEIYADQIIGMAQKALENYNTDMQNQYDEHCDWVTNYEKNRGWISKLLFSTGKPISYQLYYRLWSDKKFILFIEQLCNLARSKGTTGEKVKLSIDLDKWDMLTKYYGGF